MTVDDMNDFCAKMAMRDEDRNITISSWYFGTAKRLGPVCRLATSERRAFLSSEIDMAVEIPLTQGQIALVDDEDAPLISQYKWHAVYHPEYAGDVKYTACRSAGRSTERVSMHWFLLNPAEGEEVDHKDRNPLNNQRANLRIATRAQNQQNRKKFSNNKSGFKGVHFDKKGNKYRAQIECDRIRYRLGNFRSPVDAAKAYNAAAIKLHGEFAVLNDV